MNYFYYYHHSLASFNITTVYLLGSTYLFVLSSLCSLVMMYVEEFAKEKCLSLNLFSISLSYIHVSTHTSKT